MNAHDGPVSVVQATTNGFEDCQGFVLKLADIHAPVLVVAKLGEEFFQAAHIVWLSCEEGIEGLEDLFGGNIHCRCSSEGNGRCQSG